MIRNKPRGATVCRIDLRKNVFHVVGTDLAGNIVQRVKFRRDFCSRSLKAGRAVIGIESCPDSHRLARKLHAMLHTTNPSELMFASVVALNTIAPIRQIEDGQELPCL
jgi:hypothetical protein